MDDLTFDEARDFAARFAAWHRFKNARRNDPGLAVPRERWLEESESARLFAWVRARMAGYVKGCHLVNWTWSADLDSDREEMAGWIAEDLGMGEDPVESVMHSRHGTEQDTSVAAEICKAAGWPGEASS